jgi:hypothetical protein
VRLLNLSFTLIGHLYLWACSADYRYNACPEHRLRSCLKDLAHAHTAFQAGWTAGHLTWPQLRQAALEHCGCDSASFENSLRYHLMNNPANLEKIFSEAMNEKE